MELYNGRKAGTATVTEAQRVARHRMALFPTRSCTVLAVDPLLWVPVVALSHKVFILPGVPGLFQQLLQALLCHYIPLPPDSEKPRQSFFHFLLTLSLFLT
jgi:molybdopterin-biosynthesis enzyme MoeA-like protein